MFSVIISCIAIYYLYNKTVILERKINYLEYELVMLNTHMYEPSAPLFILND